MRLYFPVDLTGNLIMIEKLVLGEIWTGDLPILNLDALTSAPSRQAIYTSLLWNLIFKIVVNYETSEYHQLLTCCIVNSLAHLSFLIHTFSRKSNRFFIRHDREYKNRSMDGGVAAIHWSVFVLI